ncbi:MAG: heparinase II/III family protein [Colwellia sp.]
MLKYYGNKCVGEFTGQDDTYLLECSENFISLASEIFNVRKDMYLSSYKDIVDGHIKLRGEKRDIGRLEDFDWSSLVQPCENDVNWFYELSYLGFLTKVVPDADESVYELVATILKSIELEGRAGDWNKSLAWKPVSCANRLINLSFIIYSGVKSGALASGDLAILMRHGRICASLLTKLCETHLHYNHLSFCQVSVFVWNVLVSKGQSVAELDCIIRTFEEQLLVDGGQAERSPTYHIHVLALARLVSVAGVLDTELQHRINCVVERMTSALSVMTHSDGDIALFNDAALNDAPASSVFVDSSAEAHQTMVLQETGYGQLNSGSVRVILDGGDPGPADNPGHGHSDYLSIEISIAGLRFIVDPGCGSYIAGALRHKCRSGYVHNGPAFENRDLMELSGAFRVGRYSTANIFKLNDNKEPKGLIAICHPYFNKNQTLKRMVKEICKGVIVIVDVWEGGDIQVGTCDFLVPEEWSNSERAVYSLANSRIEVMPLHGGLTITGGHKYWPYGPGQEQKSNGFSIKPIKCNQYAASVVVMSSLDDITVPIQHIDPKELIHNVRNFKEGSCEA